MEDVFLPLFHMYFTLQCINAFFLILEAFLYVLSLLIRPVDNDFLMFFAQNFGISPPSLFTVLMYLL